MQFKHPEILYFLAFLIVPILVHLFQLQKFKKTPFTNVAFLQKLIHQTRKSSVLKKWLILATRLLLFSTIIIAFSQPYFSNKKAEQIQHNFIYLDNSLSTNSKGEKGNLLQNAIKEIIENVDQQEIFSLLTNSNFYKNINYSELKKLLLGINSEAISLSLNEVLLKFESLNQNKSKTSNKGFLISDFQSNKKIKKQYFTNVKSLISFIKLQNTQKNNLSIDSVYTQNSGSNNFTLHAIIQNHGEAKNNIPISLYKNETVFSKQTFSVKKDETKNILFPIQNITRFNGKIILDFSDAFSFDNLFFFSLNSSQKINVFSIGNSSNFVSKIYSENEFNFDSNSLQNINYNLLEKQDLIILNELTQIPITLSTFLQKHISQQKSVVIIPNKNIDLNSYNSFFQKLKVGSINFNRKDSVKITNINYQHPFFKNVFSKKVTNFQYPTVKNFYTSQLNNSSTLLNFNNQTPFLSKLYSSSGNIYWFSNSLNTEISNFINSPLVVPVFYNFGKLSAQQPQLFYRIGENNLIDISTKTSKNQVLKLKRNEKEFIPLQQSYATKVSIQTKEQPKEQGFYEVINDNLTIENLAFNYLKSESSLTFLNISELIKDNPNLSYSSSVEDVFQKNLEKNKVTWLWKWFLALAIVSLLFEILILKFFKP